MPGILALEEVAERRRQLSVGLIPQKQNALSLRQLSHVGHVSTLDQREDLVRAEPCTGLQPHHLSTLSSIQMLPEASRMGSASRPGATLNSPSPSLADRVRRTAECGDLDRRTHGPTRCRIESEPVQVVNAAFGAVEVIQHPAVR